MQAIDHRCRQHARNQIALDRQGRVSIPSPDQWPILGILALVGMIVRNSVILVDQIDTEIAHGRAPWDAVIEATLHRFRPILLTAAAAILGMIPIAPTVFWGPMAYSIMGGLAVATMLTLVFLPALYVAWFRIKEPSPQKMDRADPSDQLRANSTN